MTKVIKDDKRHLGLAAKAVGFILIVKRRRHTLLQASEYCDRIG